MDALQQHFITIHSHPAHHHTLYKLVLQCRRDGYSREVTRVESGRERGCACVCDQQSRISNESLSASTAAEVVQHECNADDELPFFPTKKLLAFFLFSSSIPLSLRNSHTTSRRILPSLTSFACSSFSLILLPSNQSALSRNCCSYRVLHTYFLH
ncbi:uncharacterized protein BO97DRAFT_211588 [Aspergillus homomorphus CBS 101889]|uniref:Uncharacterized protein n=1 Tax=Aspergillus homomorphus (strain CBS 101889) TaxID=1450537 RepID=A0A395IB84_ASPHC|nr:hypothetical protein BO97DRAFT_211588 [Aspergillus homomorphus CBS 101889]RAL15424.1 hypothetical protein BO97DRAFT_211588 [Aspergillus homomorphus CBS 101889]